MKKNEEILNQIVESVLSESAPNFEDVKGNEELVSIIDTILLLKEERPFEMIFEESLEKIIKESYVKKSKNLYLKIIKNTFSVVSVILGFTGDSHINEQFSYETLLKNTSSYNLHYCNFKYNSVGFSYLPLVTQNVFK